MAMQAVWIILGTLSLPILVGLLRIAYVAVFHPMEDK